RTGRAAAGPRPPDRRSCYRRRRSAGTAPRVQPRRGAGVASIHRNAILKALAGTVRRPPLAPVRRAFGERREEGGIGDEAAPFVALGAVLLADAPALRGRWKPNNTRFARAQRGVRRLDLAREQRVAVE